MINPFTRCRRSLIFCISIFLNTVVTAQNTGLSLSPITRTLTGKNSLGLESESCISRDMIYWYTTEEWDQEKHNLKIFETNYQTRKTDTLMLYIPDSVNIDLLPMISVSGDYLILTDDHSFNQYRYIRKKKEFTFSNLIPKPADSPVNTVKAINDELFLFECLYNFHPANRQFNTNLAIYNARTNKLGNFIHPALPCIAFSHLEKQWTAINKSTIALASPCEYKILLYDLDLNLKDSIIRKPDNWLYKGDSLPFNTNPAIIHPKLLIKKLQNYQDSISRIEKIYFAGDNNLLVSWISGSASAGRNIDIWRVKDSKKFTASFRASSFTDRDSIGADMNFFQLNNQLRTVIRNKTAIVFNDEGFYPAGKTTYGEFLKQKDIYYETHDPQFTVSLYKITMP